jgi:hypothetical protein
MSTNFLTSFEIILHNLVVPFFQRLELDSQFRKLFLK